MNITKNFTYAEFEATSFVHLRLKNTIKDFDVRDNIKELCETILQPLRDAWGKPLIVSSGYRCYELNKAVGGSKTSAHLKGLAADIIPKNHKDTDKLIRFAQKWLVENNIPFDQVIAEKAGSSKWLHIGLRNLNGEQRRQVFEINK